jgi:xylulokinase
MTASTLLGVDLGTSSVKVAVTDLGGHLLSEVSRTYAVESANVGWAESDPRIWWRETVLAVREAVGGARASGAASPSAVGLSGQMHGVVLADAALEPVRPAILWADARASVVMGAYGHLSSEAMARLANPIIPGLAGPILLWLRRFDGPALARARWALQPKDWLRSRITGMVLTEPSDASATLLYDVPGERWDTEVIEALGLDRALFAPLASWAGDPAGQVTSRAAEELGLSAGIQVAVGAGDTAAALFGSGLREPGSLQLTLGSGGQIVSPVDEAVRGGQGTTLFRTAARHGWYVMAATTNAGLALDWVRTLLAASWEELYAAAASPLVETDPLFLPQLTGERTPWLDTSMRGGWVGLALAHDRTTLLRSALEGVAFAVRTAMDESGGRGSPSAVHIAGGGTTHPLWRQLLADVLGRPLDAVAVTAASARGAALLGGCAGGLIDEAAVFGRLAPSTRRVSDPRADRSELATARHELWLKHVTTSRDVTSGTAP